jgi:hypothetical protein
VDAPTRLRNGQTACALAPIDVKKLTSGVTAIAAGGRHTGAIVNGAVTCWGN